MKQRLMMYSVTKIWGLKGPPLQTEEIDEDLGLDFIIHSVLVYKKLWEFFIVYLAVFYNSHFSLARFLILIRSFLKRSTLIMFYKQHCTKEISLSFFKIP